MRKILCVSLLLTLVACNTDGDTPRPGDTWVGTITSDGNVTTVVNESGSVWGGAATLVEEASIGVDAGADPYMFGTVTGIWATAEEIYVVDYAVGVVRVYDLQGTHLRDIGRKGQGPGEFEKPYRVAVDDDGTVLVSDLGGSHKIDRFTADGTYIDTWRWSASAYRMRQRLVIANSGRPFLDAIEFEGGPPGRGTPVQGVQAAGPEGKDGPMREYVDYPTESKYQEPAYFEGRVSENLPFAPRFVMGFTPSEHLVYGDAETYAFTLEAADGSKVRVVHYAELVPVNEQERSAHERFVTARIRASEPGWSWNGSPIPATKPAYESFYPASPGRLIVARRGPSEHRIDDNCIEDPGPDDFSTTDRSDPRLHVCWRDALLYDAFGPDGRYLGPIDMPPYRLVVEPVLIGDTMLLAIEDDAGTIMVKRYRLVLPEEER
jgi:hypothetical protein